ncbi:MAG TPA: patatin-like phospholipase family protein [Chitinophagaceae bacterium]|nr:patatin-like phospholipase family protein [Chitinophagaceae bacterium]
MKAWLRGFYYSFPIQALFLHFRRYQVLLVFWFILFSTVNGTFMKSFGADSLFLAPEYLGDVSAVSFAIVGIAVGMFFMSWNITTFILFTRYFRFLAATTNPFLKYCINNSIIPLSFLVFYFFKAFHFAHYKELISTTEILFLVGGFLSGFILILAMSFLYFFGADRSILRRMLPTIRNPKEYLTQLHPQQEKKIDSSNLIKVEWYIDSPFTVRKTRNVAHYTEEFIETMFKGHHFAAVLSVFASFIFLIIIGNFQEFKLFQIPAAASITVFFAILIGVSGAFAYFLQSWSIPYLIGLMLLLNVFYRLNWIDPRNKAYGLNYNNRNERPVYTRDRLLQLCAKDSVEADRQNMIRILDNWKEKQSEDKPLLVIINTSGGGQRSATFTLDALQHLDSATGGALMKKTFLITGASGGMLGAAYFRELYRQKVKGVPVNLQDRKYADDISGDLLNPLFSSFVARDLIAPAQKFAVGPYQYVKDRGYAFEQELDDNTRGFLHKQLRDYAQDEKDANIPLIFFNSVVTRDGRKMVISTQPVRFMMQPREDTARIPYMDPDAIDFVSFFARQDPYNLRILTALRMNATFPVVLPNVWLPSNPVIDVMDAGIRDNYGTETALRFLESFDDWIKENTRGVLIIQLRDRVSGGWDYPYESDDITDHITKPFLLLQHNWYKMMEYSQNDMLGFYIENPLHRVNRITFEYLAESAESKAALNFHLTKGEKKDIAASLNSPANQENLRKVAAFFNSQDTIMLPGK